MKNTYTIAAACALLMFGNAAFCQEQLLPINKDSLLSKIDHSESKYFVAVIFTSYCAGTNYVNQNLHLIDSVSGIQCDYALCQSLSRSEIKDIQQSATLLADKKNLDKAHYHFIDISQYKTADNDGRKQGMKFRNDVCAECKSDIIGVPYYIIFDKNKKILYHDYSIKPDDLSKAISKL